ncbi:putative secreted protein (Por secretion system target) [Neolewinella xylanilytica]|uniref:Putative secreted protein (Por secretion system target) n=1 Tax=Neolewinella xylanilytica TaxID=1514080 RepID=A0A2S6I1H4_9BACT|nr:PKD domain-containing protein [Neolewinella xylanilytica]PPK84806.1 putative secreted protein (Por secretion system target) [Neolewinella xylanilytica]
MKKTFISSRLVAGVAGLCLLLLPGRAFGQQVIVDPATEYQTITGFGGVNMPDWIANLDSSLVAKAFGNEPWQMGLTILRIKAPSDSGIYELQVPAARQAHDLGAIILASPWSPPVNMKTNNDIVRGELLPEYYDDYADHLMGFADFMEENGAPLHAISVQNEPDWSGATYESCDWTPQQLLTFVKEQGDKFAGINLVASESLGFNHAYTDPILNDPDAEQHLDIVGGHLYGATIRDYPLAREKGKEVWMTEHYTDSNTDANEWPNALAVGTEVSGTMQANFNAYIWWYIRRFYGLIQDDGNISKRGYVMSHFSKFIRPGAVRVDVTHSTGADITAYKTDSTLVVVAVNSSGNELSLDFNLGTNAYAEMTGYATAATMNMEPIGTYPVADGALAVSLPANSIMTFTTFTGKAGAVENVPPVADAGEDQLLTDSMNTLAVTVHLDASGSSDADGTIASYNWSLVDEQLSAGAMDSVALAPGKYDFVLTVTDNDGARAMDTLSVTIQRSDSYVDPGVWLDVECGTVGSNWVITEDTAASNGAYAATATGVQILETASEEAEDQIVLNFTVVDSTSYTLFGRVNAPSADDDSFWIRMDDGDWILWNSITGGPDWTWDDVHDTDPGNPVTYTLDSGAHTLYVVFREDGALLDKFYLSPGTTPPTGKGEASALCEPTSVAREPLTETIGLFPNPTTSTFTVESQRAFSDLRIMSIDGREVWSQRFREPTYRTKATPNLPVGTYIIVTWGAEGMGTGKLRVDR